MTGQDVEDAESGADATDGDPAEGSAGADGTGAEGSVDGASDTEADLAERVAESDPEQVATEIHGLRDRIGDLETALAEREDEVADLEDRLKRKQAEFQNYKKRMKKRREQEQERATEDLVTRLFDVRDNLVRALDQDEGADIRGGVETTLSQFDDVLERENVVEIAPEPGTEVDPQRHEVLMRVDSDQPGGTVDALQRPGYEMAGKVLRAAQVTVSDGD
jgi:molecular chaperone GrpE